MNAAQKKAASDRAKLMWANRKVKKFIDAPAVGVTPREPARVEKSTTVVVEERTTGDQWVDMPINDALQALAKLEREVAHARQVVGHRASQLPVILTCWTALHRKEEFIPGMRSAYNQCHKDIPDGKWIFRDDCVVNPETKLVEPVVVCSMLCYQLYMQYRSRLKMRERTAS